MLDLNDSRMRHVSYSTGIGLHMQVSLSETLPIAATSYSSLAGGRASQNAKPHWTLAQRYLWTALRQISLKSYFATLHRNRDERSFQPPPIADEVSRGMVSRYR